LSHFVLALLQELFKELFYDKSFKTILIARINIHEKIAYGSGVEK